jgi:SAM-dependent methyltransferase
MLMMDMMAPDPHAAGCKTSSRVAFRSAPAAERHASTIAYYNDFAAAYADLTIGIDTAERIARFASLLPGGGRVLDAGCGAGRDLIALHAAGLRPEGMDVSPRMAAIARANSKLPVVVGDLRNFHFTPASFDGIWAMASLLHIEADEIRAVLSTLRQLLLPGGVLFASVKRGRGLAHGSDGRWFTLHDEGSWEEHLRAVGFDVIEIVGEPPATVGGTGTVTPGWISSLARRLS